MNWTSHRWSHAYSCTTEICIVMQHWIVFYILFYYVLTRFIFNSVFFIISIFCIQRDCSRTLFKCICQYGAVDFLLFSRHSNWNFSFNFILFILKNFFFVFFHHLIKLNFLNFSVAANNNNNNKCCLRWIKNTKSHLKIMNLS